MPCNDIWDLLDEKKVKEKCSCDRTLSQHPSISLSALFLDVILWMHTTSPPYLFQNWALKESTLVFAKPFIQRIFTKRSNDFKETYGMKRREFEFKFNIQMYRRLTRITLDSMEKNFWATKQYAEKICRGQPVGKKKTIIWPDDGELSDSDDWALDEDDEADLSDDE